MQLKILYGATGLIFDVLAKRIELVMPYNKVSYYSKNFSNFFQSILFFDGPQIGNDTVLYQGCMVSEYKQPI